MLRPNSQSQRGEFDRVYDALTALPRGDRVHVGVGQGELHCVEVRLHVFAAARGWNDDRTKPIEPSERYLTGGRAVGRADTLQHRIASHAALGERHVGGDC